MTKDQKHTPTPWVADALAVCAEGERRSIAICSVRETEFQSFENAERIVACVNACESMPDPAAEIARLRKDLETERMRLAACGVIALSDTPDTAKLNRDIHPDYMSASCSNVMRCVDECMELRSERDRLREANGELIAALKKSDRQYMSLMEGGRNRIIDAGGHCDSVQMMESGSPYLRELRALIAKHTQEKAG